jgi:hypothetical protein
VPAYRGEEFSTDGKRPLKTFTLLGFIHQPSLWRSCMPGFTKRLLLIASLIVTSRVCADEHVGINFGFATSKSLLGASYTNGKNSFNAGLNGIAWWSSYGFTTFQPGFTYNRRLTNNNIYGTIGLVGDYSNYRTIHYEPDSIPGFYRITKEETYWTWATPVMTMGLGKTIQFTHWGIHFDFNLATPLDEKFGSAWGSLVGIGTSYRFKLGD